MNVCSECGKEFDVLYPDLWRYRTGTRWFCSWHCLRADERKRKEDYGMERLKKDGTPAKKPGPKKTVNVETPEAPVQCIAHVTPVDIEEAEQAVADLVLQGGVNYQLKVEEDQKEPEFKYTVTGINTEIGDFMRENNEKIRWEPGYPEPLQEWISKPEVSLTPEQWCKLAEIIPGVLRVLGVK